MKAFVASLATVLLASATLAAQERPAPRSVTAPPDRRVELDFQHYYTAAELRMALSSLAAAYPEFLRLESFGRSAGGRELWVMTVGSLEAIDAARKPALLLVGALGRDDLHGVELSLYTLLELVQNHGRDPRVEALLGSATLYVVPCLDPDLRAHLLESGSPRADGLLLDRNFPSGWDPWSARAGAGPYPLSAPESAALARFLFERPNVSILQTYSGRTLSVRPEAPAGAYAMLEGGTEAETYCAPRLRGIAGSALAFADGQLGIFAVTTQSVCVDRTAEGLPSVGELFQLARRAAHSTLRLAQHLPSLQFGTPAVQRLRGDVWQVDLELVNRGTLPTCTLTAVNEGECPPTLLQHDGAQLLGGALLEADGGADLIARAPLSMVALPDLQGSAQLRVRLIVQAAEDSVLELRASATRGGTARTSITLR